MNEFFSHALRLHHFQRRQTSSLTITRLFIVIMHLLIGIEFMAYNAQQVVIEKLTVGFHLDERLIGFILHLSQLRAEGCCQLWFLGFLLQDAVHLTNAIEHRLIHRLQYLVVDARTTLLQHLDGRFQRVRRHTGLYLGILQFCLHQLTIGFLRSCLIDNLLKHLRHRLRQVFLLCLIHFLP